MSKVIQKKNHWITKVNECAVIRDENGELNVELHGGAENGEFAYIGQIREDAVVYQDGKLSEGELLLEVEGLSVSGLPLYDIYTVINCCKGPVRLKTVRQGFVRWKKALSKSKQLCRNHLSPFVILVTVKIFEVCSISGVLN
ncbi:PREDICTED: membrane-associated guanylate kinase, WW and PDZ domain-containing protein 1-like [Poecilia mexicana]|uniref:membrane-associated guanylate kinase, WW and PDZ domain-containing protein 1-like n=1 Tax=Poecilia mexicana TaxID=48701 RepID=UPI00072E953A|nr:PREDICTED: membrane-associated guanylate kinase, WW and PDZ domain-containing protein 1-like [Poecilia mexicana]